jgi:hypothetical protein
MPDDDDIFGQQPKAKAISWADAPIGSVVKGTVKGKPGKRQKRRFDDPDVLEWWDDAHTQPKMQAVITLDTGEEELRSLWMDIPSAMFKAIGDAQAEAGVKIGDGGELTVKLTGTKPAKNPRFKPANQFAAKYEPPRGVNTKPADPWADDDEPPF